MRLSILAFAVCTFLSTCIIDETTKEIIDPYNGVRTVYFDDGKQVKQTITYKDSLRNGLATEYYTTGEVHTTIVYENDVKVDTAKWYYKNGVLYRSTPYENDQRHGLQQGYHDDGSLKFEMPYLDGEPKAGLVHYTASGKKKKKPKIHFSRDRRKKKGKHQIVISAWVEGYDIVAFYKGRLKRNGTVQNSKQVIKSRKQRCEYVVTVPNEHIQPLSLEFPVSAKVFTADKTCYVIDGNYHD